jgi:hypothetical protein
VFCTEPRKNQIGLGRHPNNALPLVMLRWAKKLLLCCLSWNQGNLFPPDSTIEQI